MKEKITGNTKYWEYINKEGRSKFLETFFETLHDEFKSAYGALEATELLKLMKKKVIKIRNMENFFYGTPSIDPSVTMATKSTTLLGFHKDFILACKNLLDYNTTELQINMYFILITRMIYKSRLFKADEDSITIRSLFETLLFTLTTFKPTPYKIAIQILNTGAYREVIDELGLYVSYANYLKVIKTFLSVYEEFMNRNRYLRMPELELITTVKDSARGNVVSYLMHTFGLSSKKVQDFIKDIKGFSGPRYKAAFAGTLYRMKEESDCYGISIPEIMENVRRIYKGGGLQTYNRSLEYMSYIDVQTGRTLLGEFGIAKHIFVPEGHAIKYFKNCSCEIEVDCTKCESIDQIKTLLGIARKLCYYKQKKTKSPTKSTLPLYARIILKGPAFYTKEFVDEISSYEKSIKSNWRTNVLLVIQFQKESVRAFCGNQLPTHIRVISDMHVDHSYNIGEGYYFNFGNDFVVNCGDTAGDAKTAFDWMKQHMPLGVFTVGNHLGYSSIDPSLDGYDNIPVNGTPRHYTNLLNYQIRYLVDRAKDKYVYTPILLYNSTYEYNGVYFIGSPLYTNFTLYGENNQLQCMGTAKGRINDYNYVKVLKDTYMGNAPAIMKGEAKSLTPADHLEMFNICYNYIKSELQRLKGKPVVVFTHFAPSYYCIEDKYKKDPLSSFFASNCSALMKEFNIRLWCFGHVHKVVDFIYGKTRVVACPFGYGNENKAELPEGYGIRISFDDLKSKKEWKTILGENEKQVD